MSLCLPLCLPLPLPVRRAIDFEATESRLFNRAFLLMRTGRTDAAIEGYRAVAAMAPANFQARAALGTLLLQRDDFKGAIPVLKEAEALNKAAVDIVFNLGFAYLREDDVDAAEAQFKRALEIDPDMDNAKNGLAAVEAARDSTKLNVTVGETIEVPGSSGPGSSSAAASGSGAGSAAPAAAAAAGGAGSSAAAAAPAAPGAAAPAASAGSAAAAGASPAAARPAIAGAVAAPPSATPALAAMRTASARREVRASVPPQLLGALAASMRGPAEAMGGAGGAGGVGPVAEDSEVRFTRDEDGVEGVVFAYAQLKAPGPYPAGVDSSHREVSRVSAFVKTLPVSPCFTSCFAAYGTRGCLACRACRGVDLGFSVACVHACSAWSAAPDVKNFRRF